MGAVADRMIGGATVLGLLVVAVVAVAPADAATVTFSTETVEGYKTSTSTYGTTRFAAGPGETNSVTVTFEDGRVVMRDVTAPVHAGKGCEEVDAHAARCAVPALGLSLSYVVVDLLDGDDSVDARTLRDDDAYGRPHVDATKLHGGPGADKLIGSATSDGLSGGDGDDLLDGGDDDDELVGGSGSDRLMAGDGIDTLNGDGASAPPAPDILDGGPGRDEVRYVERTTPVRVDLSHSGGNGAPGEGDVITGVDNVVGGTGADTLVGDDLDNRLDGCNVLYVCQGDVLAGRGGRDQLTGGSGNDRIDGGAGDDTLEDDTGDDRLFGGDGDDRLFERPGRDLIDGGDGDDALFLGSDTVRDTIVCGAGSGDRALEPRLEDAVGLDCERFELRELEVTVRRAGRARRPGLRFAFEGRGPGRCVGTVRLQSRGRRPRVLDERRFAVHPDDRFAAVLRSRGNDRGPRRLRLDFERCRGQGRELGYGFGIRGGL